MKKLLFLSLVLFLSNPGLVAQKNQERLETVDILHYNFALELNDENDEIKGTANVTVKFKKASDRLVLDLVNRKEGKGMYVNSVLDKKRQVRFKHENGQLTLWNRSEKDEEITFTISYSGVPQTGLIIAKNKHGDRTFFGDNWPDRGQHWLPLVDHPADKSTVEWRVTAPAHYKVIGNGELVEEKEIENGNRFTHWRSTVQLPTKVMVIGAARFAIDEVGDAKGTPISSWVYPQDEKAGFYDYALALPITEWFIENVGPYPYAKLANVQSKTQFGGMENASNIFYSENSITGRRTSEGLIAHEVAHQWFGNSASEANWHHAWLSEGFATYFTNLYFEQTHGRDAMVERMQRERTQVIDYYKRNPAPIVNTAVEEYMRLLNANTYQKGGWVLHMLRKEVGDENFWKAIRAYYDRYKLSNALTKDLKNVFEEVTGKELDAFFQQWIFVAGQPDLEIKVGAKSVTVTQKQSNLFSFPLEVELQYSDGSSERKTIQMNQKTGSISASSGKTIKEVVADPDSWLLFEGSIEKE